ncbi:hypothetical protein [Billgrantia endophytica]|uniref:MgtC/SapB transporter n=1 Tax=Billgrantia endophytica TaxID=2033802 RepID=A0A2N7U815_9GAMM|nr:hypothetical protein [Halomonas endophytica]PMR76566.1 hypothetical protein C1H69_05870 [Halomonas endophytica]
MDDVASQFITANETFIQLAVALLLGALIGIERGWVAREDSMDPPQNMRLQENDSEGVTSLQA